LVDSFRVDELDTDDERDEEKRETERGDIMSMDDSFSTLALEESMFPVLLLLLPVWLFEFDDK
jgi:hypothetical protein